MRVGILASGHYLPELEVPNSELKQFPPNAIPLIEQKTGIRARRFAANDQITSDLAFLAAKACLERAGVGPEILEGIILATSSPDRIQPATAARVQHLLGAGRAFAVDVNSVCSGGLFAIQLADGLIRSGTYANMLVIAAELYSRILNPSDFATYPYFGDGAAAVLLSANGGRAEIDGSIIRTDGSGADIIQVPAGGTMMPGPTVSNPRDWYFNMRGREVYEFAVQRGSEVLAELMARHQLAPDRIKAVVPHQANINIIRAIAQNCGIPLEKFYVNLDRYGNTAGASVLIGLSERLERNDFVPGDSLALVAFGGGLSWGATMIKY